MTEKPSRTTKPSQVTSDQKIRLSLAAKGNLKTWEFGKLGGRFRCAITLGDSFQLGEEQVQEGGGEERKIELYYNVPIDHLDVLRQAHRESDVWKSD